MAGFLLTDLFVDESEDRPKHPLKVKRLKAEIDSGKEIRNTKLLVSMKQSA